MDAPTPSEWSLLPVFDDAARRLPTMPSNPYGALVVAEDFSDEVGREGRIRLCVQLVLSGCRLVDFHGIRSTLADDWFDEWAVILGLALAGDRELELLFAKFWEGAIDESPAARWKTYDDAQTIFTTEGRHVYDEGDIDDSLAGSIEMIAHWTTPPPEQILAIPLDDPSALALREALGTSGVTWSAFA